MDYEKYMGVAIKQAGIAFEAGDFPVGCVIVYEDKVIATGKRQNSTKDAVNEIDHAEMAALREFFRYPKSINKENAMLFCTLEPCLMCYAAILLSGIGTIVYAYEDVMGGGTSCDLSSLTPLYAEATINIISGVLRNESLDLFVKFFKNPENNYWKNSFLEKYTLSLSNCNKREKCRNHSG